jgi:hypothetical protein
VVEVDHLPAVGGLGDGLGHAQVEQRVAGTHQGLNQALYHLNKVFELMRQWVATLLRELVHE